MILFSSRTSESRLIVYADGSHYDHLDPDAVLQLGDSCEWVVPMGAGNFFRDLGVTRVTELE